MRLRGWHVEGFGLLHDFRVGELPDGLTVVLGPNEAGKTSLLAFIRGVLFGYPDRRKKDRQYPPLRGGRHGGRLLVESDGSTFIVERFASPAHFSITQPDGSLGTEAVLRRLLGGVDAELHRNVFAFSLSELQEFESLQVEGVRDRIFAAGVVGAGRSARAAIDRLVSQREEIGKKRGECRINGLRKLVEELDEMLKQAKARATRHPELRRTADELDEEQRSIGRGLADTRREMAHLDALLAAWPDWDERVQAGVELAMLAGTPDLPGDLGTRLDSALVDVRTHSERHRERDESVHSLDQQFAALCPDERLVAASGEVKRLAGQAGSVRAWRARLGILQTQFDDRNKRLAEEAPRLGPGWTLTSVREFDASIPAAQVIADWGGRLNAADQSVHKSEDQERSLGSDAKVLADEASHRSEALKGDASLDDSQVISERDSAVRRLRAKCAQLVAVRADHQAATQRLREASFRAAEARAAAEGNDADVERRTSAIRSAPVLPTSEDIARRERAVRELRTGLADLAACRADLRAASQRALDAKQRASDAEFSAATASVEVRRRDKALADANPVPDAESIAARERAARELRSKLVDLAVLSSDLRAAEMRLADRRRDTGRHTSPSATPSLKRPILVVVGGLGVLAVVLLLLSQFTAAAVAIAAAVAGTFLAVGLPGVSTAAPGDGSSGIAEAERGVQELAGRIATLEGSAKPLAARLGFSALPDPAKLEETVDEIGAQARARLERDRESAAVGQLRKEAEQAQVVTERLTKSAMDLQAEVDDVVSHRVGELEVVSLTSANILAFAELPSAVALEEKAVEVGDLADKRREREVEASAVQALELAAARARDVAARLDKECADLRSSIDSGPAVRESDAEASALTIAVSLGLTEIPEPADLEERAKQIDDQIRARRDRDREAAAIDELRRRADTAGVSAGEALETLAACRRERDTLRAEWSAWKAENGCAEALRPETAQQFFASVERLRESLGQLDAMAAERVKLFSEVKDFSESVFAVAERAGFPRSSETALAEDVIEGLRERSEADTQIRSERARVGGELERARTARASSERDSGAASNALASVLAEAGASDERECRARIEASRIRADLSKKAREAEHRLRTRLGVGMQADAVRTELASGDRQGWDARKSDCKGTLAKSQPVHEDALRKHQTAIETLSALERECDVVTLATEREAVVVEIREALSEWRLLAIAQSLVQATLRRYEVERQPAVLTRAASSFSRITDGRYSRLVTREDGIDLIAADGSRLDAAALSRGTAEQLYLCLRLALAAEFGRLAVPLPFVMDDVLVNFDPERARVAAEVLLAAAPDHQILLFTCHPETVDLFIGLEPSTRVIEIQRQTPIVHPGETGVAAGGSNSTTRAVAGARQVTSASGSDLSEAVLSSIRAAGRPLSRSDILASTGMTEAQWIAVSRELRDRGLVLTHGRKRGATWGLAGSTSPAPSDD